MLTRKCVPNLFESEDYNVRVTYFDNHPDDYSEEAYKKAWIESIHDSIGGGIKNSNTTYSVVIRTETDLVSCCLTGNEITDFISKRFKATSIRLDIFEGKKKKTWIVLVVPRESRELQHLKIT